MDVHNIQRNMGYMFLTDKTRKCYSAVYVKYVVVFFSLSVGRTVVGWSLESLLRDESFPIHVRQVPASRRAKFPREIGD